MQSANEVHFLIIIFVLFLRFAAVPVFETVIVQLTSHKRKACVRYFLSNFYFSLNDSTLKTMKNVFYLI